MARRDVPLRVGILGATGLVGQRLVALLETHPWFEVTRLGASDRSKGNRYENVVRWGLPGGVPASVAGRTVEACEPDAFRTCDVSVSALDSRVAGPIERAFVEAGHRVVSNSSAHRMEPDVPLVIPEVNADHLDILGERIAEDRGFLVTNPNCSVIGLAMVLAPIHRRFGVRRVVVATLQALSGAGLDGPAALDLVDNVLPYISGEEDKMHEELGKLLGAVDASRGTIRSAEIPTSAHCHRVATIDGHLEAASIELASAADPETIVRELREFRGAVAELGLPTAPNAPVEVRLERDRPQPRLDRDVGDGMTVVVGRIRPCPALSIRLELLSHNTIRGAAGAALLNAELLAHRGWLRSVDSR